MNIRKPTDYSTMFAALDELVAADLPQVKLYRGIGRLVSSRPEKGAAVAAAEYLHSVYPDVPGFSPRNLRRMRDFYRTYESDPELMAAAMTIGWTQNIVILESELTLQETAWYIHAVQQFGWSKLKLAEQIASDAHQEIIIDLAEKVCYTEENNVTECMNDDEDPLYLHRQHMPQSNGRVRDEGSGEEGRTGNTVPHRVRRHQHRGAWQPGLSPGPQEAGRAWDRLREQDGAATHQQRLRQVRPPDWNGPGQPAEYAPCLRRRFCREAAPPDGLYRPPRRGPRKAVLQALWGEEPQRNERVFGVSRKRGI